MIACAPVPPPRLPGWLAGAVAWVAVVLLAGCASVRDPYAAAPVAEHLKRDDDVGRCARLLRDLDRRIDAAGVRDAMTPQVPGFPYLRVDRLTAALGAQARTAQQQTALAHLMAQLDEQARRLELQHAGEGLPAPAAVQACRTIVSTADERPEERARNREALRQAAAVPDDYSLALRTLGVYPLTRIPFAAGVRAWQRDTEAAFDTPLPQLPMQGRLMRYAPAVALERVPRVMQAPQLGLPVRTDAQLRALILRHAPLIDVDTATDDDRIGALRWAQRDGRLQVVADTTEPVAYVRLAHALLGGRPKLQIVYTVWFPARPAAGAFDVLAGALDGLTWRVTLDAQGEPLVYDTIHPCGCYHLFFPTARVHARPAPRLGADGEPEGRLDETLFMPQDHAPKLGNGERIVLRVAARSHYLQRVGTAPAEAALTDARPIRYALRDDDELRSLPLPEGGATPGRQPGKMPTAARRSAFGPDGMIAGTQRMERFFFWPMGIESAGQMRQWGRHATAFVGRRHFDDPLLLDRYFAVGDRKSPAND